MNIETKEIIQVVFGIQSPNEIRNQAAVEITSEDTFANGRPVDGGLFDLKMGPLEASDICATCGLDRQGCVGHFGYLKLTSPLYHPSYSDEIRKLLEIVCIKCSAILIDDHDKEHIRGLKSNVRLNNVRLKLKSKPYCAVCDLFQKVIKREKNDFQFKIISEDNKKEILPNEAILKILKRITPDDAELLGFSASNRPEWMILTDMVISPPIIRPTIITDNNQRGEDDLTIRLAHIVKMNNTLQIQFNKNPVMDNIKNTMIETLQMYLSSMIFGTTKKSGSFAGKEITRTGKPLKSFYDRISSKTGRFRKNIMGKRVDYSARSVITPDPNLELSQLGVPLTIAKILTYPEIVNDFNKDEIYRYIANTKTGKYPMAIFHQRNNNKRKIEFIKEDIILETGDIVVRQLIDGDITLFNRQPTLHKPSMQAFKCKIMPGKTFRINLSVTTAFNADFDGDEMNMFFPQSIASRHEIWTLARPEALIVNGAQNGPLFGIVQDSLLGAFLMTMNSTNISKSLAMNILALNNEFIDKVDKSSYKGNELFSTIIPEINMNKATNTFTKDSDDKGDYEDGLYSKELYEKIKKEKESDNYKKDSIIKVINGKIIQGAIDKKAGLGATNEGSFAHLIWLDFGQDYAGRFLSLVQKYTNKFLLYRGFSVGLGDIAPSKQLKSEMNNIICNSLEKMYDLLKRVDKGLLIVPQDTTVAEYIEKKATEYFAPISGKVGVLALAHLNVRDNALKAMIISGSKGKELNAGQMMGCVGHNTINQARIKMTYGNRTLPFYYRGDNTPEARGFIQHSFIDGLNPMEYFFHAMSGREGVIDTAIKTADSGYVSRRLMKALEDYSVDYYNKVTNSGGQIIQFLYGDDGIDPVYVERQKFKTILMTKKEIDDKYKVLKPTNKTKEQLQKIKDDRDFLISINFVYENGSMGQVFLPVNIERIIQNFPPEKEIISYNEAVDIIENLIEDLPRLFRNRLNTNLKIISNIKNASRLLAIVIRSYLSAKQIVEEYKLGKISIEAIVSQIKMKYLQSIAQPGEMVGVVTAQGIGEPSTQLTLNSFVYETRIIIRDQDKNCHIVQMGEFVDKFIKENNEGIIYYEDKDTYWAPPKEHYEIQAPDENGIVKWYRIEAGTRHPVINEDGSDKMLKVTTEYEQEVIATKGESFLQLIDGKLKAVRGDSLKVGDYLPVSIKRIVHKETEFLDLKEFFSPYEYIFGSEAMKAIAVSKEYHWWQKHFEKTFIVPHNRSDTFLDRMKEHNSVPIEDGFIYPKKTWKTSCKIPEKIPLDYNFGYLIGAYCAEGCITTTQISIANNNPDYFKPIYKLCKAWEITTKYYVHEDKNNVGWTSSDLRLYSTLLTELLEKLCGKLSHGKFVHQKLIFSNYLFKFGFLAAYFGGDGHLKKNIISAHSVSYTMLQQINIMLKTLGIFSRIKKLKKQDHNNRGTLPENIQQPWNLIIQNFSMYKLAIVLNNNILIPHKQEICEYILNKNNQTEYLKSVSQVPNFYNNKIIFEKRVGDWMRHIVFVQITNIQEVKNTTPYAYDLTVAATRNLITAEGLIQKDTFHFSGVGEKSNITAGMPRLNELLSVTHNTKNPYLIIRLKDVSKQNADIFKNKIKNTYLSEFVDMVEIHFDPDIKNSNIESDRQMIKDYLKYSISDSKKVPNDISPWVIRMELNRTKMVYNQMRMNIVKNKLNEYSDYYTIVSDDNAPILVLRVHLVGSYVSTEQIIANKNKILNDIVLRGINGITNARVVQDKKHNQSWVYDEKEDKLVQKQEYYIDTDGINLKEILAQPEVDTRRTRSIDLWEMFNTFGIEAARNTLLAEFRNVLSTNGAYVNYHLLSLLVDMMTFNGNLISITRFGFNKLDKSPISKISFEMMTEQLKLAAINHAEDQMQNVSARIMFGQTIRGGTGKSNLILDENSYGVSNDQIDDMFS